MSFGQLLILLLSLEVLKVANRKIGVGGLEKIEGGRDSLRPPPLGLELYYAKQPIPSMAIMAHHPISPVISHHHQYSTTKSIISHALLIILE